MHFSSLHFGVISILVSTFVFYHFQSPIQLTRVILVIFISQQMEIADVANRLIKILIKIHCGSRHPCHMGFSPLYSHMTLTTLEMVRVNPQIGPPSPKPNQSTFSLDLRQPSNHHRRQTNPEIYIPKPIFLGIAEKRKAVRSLSL